MVVYEAAFTQYNADLAAYNAAVEAYPAALAQYNADLAQYNETMKPYNTAVKAYEEALAKRKEAFKAADDMLVNDVQGSGLSRYLPLYNSKAGYHERNAEVCFLAATEAVAIANLCDSLAYEKEVYLVKALNYFELADDEQAGYAELKTLIDNAHIDVTKLNLEAIKAATDAAAKSEGFKNILTRFESFPLNKDHAKYPEVVKGLVDLAIDVATKETTAEGKATMLSTAADFLPFIKEDDADLPNIKVKFNKENLALVKIYADSLASLTEIADKEAALLVAYEQCALYPLDSTLEGYGDVMKKIAAAAMEVAQNYITKFEASESLVSRGAYIKSLAAFLKKFENSYFMETEGYKDKGEGEALVKGLKTRFDAGVIAYEKEMQAAKDRVELYVPLTEYSNKVTLWFNDWEAPGGSFDEGGVLAGEAYTTVESGADLSNPENHYFVIHSYSNSDPNHQIKMSTAPIDKTVYEFDLTTFTNIPGEGLWLRGYGFDNYPGIFEMDKDGNLWCGNAKVSGLTGHTEGENKNLPCAANIITPGEWTHLAFVYDPISSDVTLYVNYEKKCTHHATTSADNETKSTQYTSLYFKTSSVKGTGSLALDNLLVYQGSAPRTRDKMDKYSDYEKYLLAAKVISYVAVDENDEAPDAYVKAAAWGYVKEIHKNYYDETQKDDARYILPKEITDMADGEEKNAKIAEFKAAVDAYNAFDDETAMKGYREDTLKSYLEKVNELLAIDRNPNTLQARKDMVASISAFLKVRHNEIADGEKILHEGKEITQRKWAEEQVADQELKIANEDDINSFNAIMQAFNGCTDAAQKINYRDQADALASGLDQTLLEAVYPPKNEGEKPKYKYEKFREMWELYKTADEEVEAAVRVQNTKDIIGYFSQIAKYDNEEKWKANYEDIRAYVELIRPIVRSGRYTLGLENYDLAPVLEKFALVDAWFYQELQKEHIAFLETNLAAFLASDSYVEKMGICRLIQNYIDKARENEAIDPENKTIATLIDTHKIYTEEAEVQEGDYGTLLDQNTVYFINLARAIDTCIGYKERKAAYDKATVYYFSMNVGSDEAKAAIEIYESVGRELALIESSSQALMAAVAEYNTAEDADGKYTALSKCCYYAQFVDKEYEGVSVALEAYAAAYAGYNAEITAANNDVVNSASVVASARASCGLSAIVKAILNKIFG